MAHSQLQIPKFYICCPWVCLDTSLWEPPASLALAFVSPSLCMVFMIVIFSKIVWPTKPNKRDRFNVCSLYQPIRLWHHQPPILNSFTTSSKTMNFGFSLAVSRNLCDDVLIWWNNLGLWICMSVLPPPGPTGLSAGVRVKRMKLLFHDQIRTVFRLN